jgi:CBS domain-containing protein
MKVHEIMTAHARCVGPENTLVEAAGLMRALDVGALPVCDDDEITGIVTDRDLTLRGTADGRDPNTTLVSEVMSTGVACVFAEQEVEEIARLMEARQIRRVPVLNHDKKLVGIVSLADIAISSNPAFSGMALRDVSEPREPTARQRRLAERSRPARVPRMTGGAEAGETPQRRGAGRRTRKPSIPKRTKRSSTGGRGQPRGSASSRRSTRTRTTRSRARTTG